MRAMALRGTELVLEEMPRPAPGSGEVLARVRACGICGSDLHFARYRDLNEARVRGPGYTPGTSRPIVMGHEFVAEVVEAGAGCEMWQPGTRVTGAPWMPD